MFYEPQNGHGLPHNPFNALISPRPIGWISTRGADGSENLAPYSFFNATAYVPPQVMFASVGSKPDRDGTKDSLSNIRETMVFCANIVGIDQRDPMNTSSGAWSKETDEFTAAGLERSECETIPCSRVTAAPASLECKVRDIITLAGDANYLVLGEVTGIHMRDDCIVNGIFDVTKYQPLARMGYKDYAVVRDVFSLSRPGE